MRPLFLALVLLPWLVAAAPATADDPAQSGAEPVGKVTATEGSVKATLGADTRDVVRGEAVYRGDWIETDRKARAKLVLNDETELIVGPASRIHIDEFVYDGKSDKGKVLLEMSVGLMRFTSGVLESESYEVTTPVASIGVRGTIFDLIMANLLTIILREGKIVIKTFTGSEIVSKKGHASSAASNSEDPEPQRKATDDEDDLTDPLKKPFKDEMPSAKRRPNVPSSVQKPTVKPNQSSRPSGRPNIPSSRY